MTIGLRRYVFASLGGAAFVGAAVSGVHLLGSQTGAAASVGGALPADCAMHGSVVNCSDTSASAAPPDRRPETFRDGAYEVTGDYLTPGGAESIGVAMTLRHGMVTASSVRVEAKSPTARQFQVQFASRYATRVVSRDIAGLNLSRVAGASLTSIGFDDAIARVQEEAHE